MNETDAFFTQTIVGAPFSVLLGRQLVTGRANTSGIEINMLGSNTRLSRLWRDWIVITDAYERIGQPQRRAGVLRRWLERHAMWIAVLGVSSLLTTAFIWGLMQWK
jgi:hypothetical protein